MMEATLISALPFLPGIIFAIAGAIMYLFPPRKINSLYGYRTPGSMRTERRWNFAQRYSAKRMLESGIFLMAIGIVMHFTTLDDAHEFVIGLSLLILSIAYMFFTTERALNRKFPNNVA